MLTIQEIEKLVIEEFTDLDVQSALGDAGFYTELMRDSSTTEDLHDQGDEVIELKNKLDDAYAALIEAADEYAAAKKDFYANVDQESPFNGE